MNVLDFETKPIEKGSPKKPAPVGLAAAIDGQPTRYAAFGHASDNGIYEVKRGKIVKVPGDPEALAKRMFKEAIKKDVLGHNIAKFDLPVAEDAWGIAPPPWERVHDTLFSLFLAEPHATSLGLKESAQRRLGRKPEERDEVFEWLAAKAIIRKRVEKGVTKYGTKEDPARAHIWQAPGSLVAAYAIGDCSMALDVHNDVFGKIRKDRNPGGGRTMLDAYNVERELAPILRDNERRGMRVDLPALERDLKVYEKILAQVDAWLRKRMRTPGLNLDSDDEVAAALKKARIVKDFPKTEGGKDSVSKKKLTQKFFSDPMVWFALYYRNALATVITMSMRPWLEQGSRYGGYIFTDWNQVRQSHGNDAFKGARSGRITCSYFQNITKDFTDRGDGYGDALKEGWLAKLSKLVGTKLPDLPLVRVYLLPDEGDVFGHSDVDQQELKMVAHYEEGALAEEYNRDPKTDIHTFVQQLVHKTCGKLYDRRPIKIVDFRTVYGGGKTGLADHLQIPYKEASQIIDDWKAALPDVVALDRELKLRFKEGKYIRTLGGRIYYCKPPTIAKKGPRKGQTIHFEYTALNYLIQPSAADQTKQAIINYHKHPKRKARMVVTVHDEINISAAPNRAVEELKILRDCMVGAYKLDVPTTTTLKVGASWGTLKKLTEDEIKGRKVA